MKKLLVVFCSILILLVFFKCAKDEPEFYGSLKSRTAGDTTYRIIQYGYLYRVYPNTISRCWNKKAGRFEYQATIYGESLLPACKFQQTKYYDKITISDTALISPLDTFYVVKITKK
jgi:hypothetical protein